LSLHLLLAPAASGKTKYCITRIRELERENPLAPIWVIVPNGANGTAFRRRLGDAGGAIGVHVSTFYSLYSELLAQAERLVARLDEPILYRLLRDVAAELHTAGKLNFFANIHTTPGFARALHSSIQELKRARIMPDKFTSQVQGRHARLEELARLYDAYQQRLLAADWADAEGQGWLAALALEHDENLARGWQLLVVDGFDEFNPTQLAVLKFLTARSDETLITLTGNSRNRLAHHRFARARAAIESTLSPCLPVVLSPRPITTPIAQIESMLFESPLPPLSKTGEGWGRGNDHAIELIQAPNRAEEIRAAMRWLKARIVRDELKPSQVALLARDIEAYRAFIEETAAEFGVPIFLRAGANLATNPAIAALLNLLALVAQDFPRRRIIDAWRNPYSDWSAQGIQANDAEQLDAAARWGQVVASIAQWQDTLTRLANATTDDESTERDDPGSRAPTGASAATLSKKFDAFVARITPPANAPVRGYVAWLEELIGEDPTLLTEYERESDTSLHLVRCARKNLATSERDVAALRELKNVLRALVFAESILGGAREISFVEFWNDLRGAVEASAYQVVPPQETESILVTSVLSARGLSFRAVALVGLAEGEFPRAATEDPLLPESDRAMLKLSPRLSGDEVTFFYEAVTRATEKLLLTRPYLADDGQPWEESPYWKHIRELIDVEPARSDAPLSQADAASFAELNAILKSSDAITHGARVLAARMADDAHGMYEGDLSAMQSRLARDYPSTRPWSASRLETFGTCPFAFFAAYGLHLEPRAPTEAGFDVRQLGTMYHAILETLYRNVPDPTHVDALLAALPNIARKIFDDAPTTYGFRPTELWQQQRAELERILTDTVRALNEASVGWKPARFEIKFDSLVLRDDTNEIRLRGYIDRVDVNDAGDLRVLDYKAGSSPISKQDLDDGKRLQLALYALALRDEIKLGHPTHGLYWHIGAAKASSLKLEKYPGGAEAAFETATTHALSHTSRVRAGDFAPHVPSGGCPAWCPATAFCWRYKPKG
jgi:ATP-dependent helicase/nuclease subunit B